MSLDLINHKETTSTVDANGVSGGSKVSIEKLFTYNNKQT